jgi:hypothetical protein
MADDEIAPLSAETPEQATTGGFAYLLSYPSPFLIDDEAPPVGVDFEFGGHKVHVEPPIRLGHTTWRPIPLLNAVGALKLFNNNLAALPLQVAAIPGIGADKTSALSVQSGRGEEYNPNLPPDTLIIAIHGANQDYQYFPLISQIIEPMIVWLRILTKQWWLGRGTPKQTGNAHFSFEFTNLGTAGPIFAPLCSQTAPDPSISFITKDIWLEAFNLAIGQADPPFNTVLIYDTEYYRSNREYTTACLLACGWAEVERDLTLEASGIRISSLNVSSTDLLKQLSSGFERAFSRNLKTELSQDFEFLRSLWRTRGEVAHGRPFRWNFEGQTELAHYQNFGVHLGRIADWFRSIRTTLTQ